MVGRLNFDGETLNLNREMLTFDRERLNLNRGMRPPYNLSTAGRPTVPMQWCTGIVGYMAPTAAGCNMTRIPGKMLHVDYQYLKASQIVNRLTSSTINFEESK